jgi:hypothetical protein
MLAGRGAGAVKKKRAEWLGARRFGGGAKLGIPARALPAGHQMCVRAGLRDRPGRGQLRERAGVT